MGYYNLTFRWGLVSLRNLRRYERLRSVIRFGRIVEKARNMYEIKITLLSSIPIKVNGLINNTYLIDSIDFKVGQSNSNHFIDQRI